MLTAADASSTLLGMTNSVGMPDFTGEGTTALMETTSATVGSASTMAEPSGMQTESAITMDTTVFVAPSTQVEVFSAPAAVRSTSVESVSTTLEPSSTPTEPSPAPGSVRLVDGTGPHEGRVEIFYSNTWGTVCDNNWSLGDGLVVCRQLGYPGVVSVHRRAHFGEGTGPILFDNLICKGTEGNLTQCPNGEVNCDHSEDAGVTCARETVSPTSSTKGPTANSSVLPSATSMLSSTLMGMTSAPIVVPSVTLEPSSTPTEPSPALGSVRLVDGTGPHEGRVEIFYNNTWGTVCDNHWSLKDGLVVCRQLGYPGVLSVYREAHFGEGIGPILFDNLICKGTEGNLTQCPNGEVNCDHSEDAGVTCARETVEPSSTPTEPSPALGSVRLVDGTGPHEGRVEIFYNNTWGTVCDNHWSLNDGLVVCRQLGYPGVLSVYKRAHFGEGTGPILFDNLRCKGTESNLTQCPNGEVNCDHSEDAGVTCARETVSPTSSTKGPTANSSVLPLATSMLSSTLMGMTSAPMVVPSVTLEPSSTPTEPSPAPGSVRLVDGTGPHEGRVEIFYSNTWGTVCDNNWSLGDGLVVCRQLGYPGVVSVHQRAHFGEGTGPILFDNLICKGTEGNLTQCPNGEVNCDHSEDAGVTCARETVSPTSSTKGPAANSSVLPLATSMLSSTLMGMTSAPIVVTSATLEPSTLEPSSTPTEPSPAPGSLRLVDGTGPHEGRVEIFYNNTWGTVCDNHWSLNDGLVVCRQLGYPGVLSVYREAHFGEGTGPILFDNLICKGTEGNLTQCPNGDVNCDHSEDAGVTCARETTASSISFKSTSVITSTSSVADSTSAVVTPSSTTVSTRPSTSPTPSPTVDPQMPKDVSVSTPRVTDGAVQIILMWSKPGNDSGLTGYQIQYSWESKWDPRRFVKRQSERRTMPVPATPTSYTLQDAEGFAEYCFAVSALYEGREESPATDEECTTTPETSECMWDS